MNIDELANAIEEASPDRNGRGLAAVLRNWKADAVPAETLADIVERYIGHTWFDTDEIHATIYSLWSSFREEAIHGIGGMTMNERLYYFGLFERCEKASPAEREAIYAKLHARS
jgi:hypothetical protein